MNLGDSGATYLSLPPNFQTEESDALGYAIDRQLKKLMEAGGNIGVWTNHFNVPEKYYDYMAASIRAPYYASQYDAKTRLGILESAFQVYMFAGTCKGVEELVGKVFSGKAVFVPWHEYNGRPYHFKISVHSSPVRDTLDKFREILKRVKSKRSVLDVVEYIINFIINMPEEMDIVKTSLRTQVFFWNCDILNGTRFLDGSVHVDAKRRYDLVLWVKNGIKCFIKETMDTGRVNILSCFNVHENINGLKAVFKLGCSGLCRLLNNEMPLKMEVLDASTVQCMDIPGLANGTVKVRAEEKTGTALACRAAVNSWRAPGQVLTAGARHMAAVQIQEAVGNVIVTYRRNLHYLDGSKTLDGSRLVNAFYGKEDI